MSLEYVIYGTPDCHYCKQAVKLLEHAGIPYTYMDARSSEFFQQTFVSKGIRTVPQIFAREDTSEHERHVGGFEELMKEVSL